MMVKHYICNGTCHGVATEVQWKKGAKTCSAQSCNKYKVPLVEREYCSKCKAHYKVGEKHKCK